ncbi:MAG: type VI secretion system-associated FHA domain protein [Ramlibacter sp.]
MVIDLHIAGPGLDVVRRMEQGEPELVLGRDADCTVVLPDPQRNVSRRHLSLWLEAGELHFRVLSVVNGIEMPFGEAPPGARGVLPLGQTLKLAEYSLVAALVASAPPPAAPQDETNADPWAVFDRGGDRTLGEPAERASLASGQAGGFPAPPEDDPFGEWGFETTFGPGGAGGGALDAAGLAPGDVSAFFHGLGLDPKVVGALTQGELEAIGRLVRTLMLGILDLHASATGTKQELRAEDRTMMAVKDNNPLKTDWPPETKLRYMFGGRAAGVGFINPERAAREVFVELIAHNTASGAAARAALEATIKEFAPAALKARLLGGGTKLFEGARAWDAYSKYYEEQGRDLPKWTQRLLDKYFADAYLRESVRIRRETPSRKR